MRRAFSGLFGRFFAQAYWQDIIVSLGSRRSTESLSISKRMHVARLPGKGTELPDWVCGSASSRIAVAEAKGTSQPSNGTGAGLRTTSRPPTASWKVVSKLRKVAGKERWTAVHAGGGR